MPPDGAPKKKADGAGGGKKKKAAGGGKVRAPGRSRAQVKPGASTPTMLTLPPFSPALTILLHHPTP
jgi:hypothetical protein